MTHQSKPALKITSSVLNPAQARDADEWLKITDLAGVTTGAKGLSLKTKQTRYFDQTGSEWTSDRQLDVLLWLYDLPTGAGKPKAYQKSLTDSDFEGLYPNWPKGGLSSLANVREKYSDLGASQTTWNIDEDVLAPIILTAGSSPISQSPKTYLYNSWSFRLNGCTPKRAIYVGRGSQEPPTDISGLIMLLSSRSKDSPLNRRAYGSVIDMWQDTDLTDIMTDAV